MTDRQAFKQRATYHQQPARAGWLVAVAHLAGDAAGCLFVTSSW